MANTKQKGSHTATAQEATTAGPLEKTKYSSSKPWYSTAVWIETVCKEASTRKQWERIYGWMADYDAKGNFLAKQRSFANPTPFSTTVPNCHGHDYGWHLQTHLGIEVNKLQVRYDSQHRKRRPTEILGYD